MNVVLRVTYLILSDMYRLYVLASEFFTKKKQPNSFDVAYITNFQNSVEQGFMGVSSLWSKKSFALALKLQMNNVSGRYVAINSIARDMVKDPATGGSSEGMKVASTQVLEAIEYSANNGAKVVLFGASTKRLFSNLEINEIKKQYPSVTFTIGDNGTICSLWQDVELFLEETSFQREDGILLIGPNGFLGSVVREKLQNFGYSNIMVSSQKQVHPFENVKNVKLVVACSHHKKLRLTASIIQKISHTEEGLHVIDVCRPANFNRREFNECQKLGITVTRQDSGNMRSEELSYAGSLVANVALKQLNLSQKRLFGCFSEATALATVSHCKLSKYDFFDVNEKNIYFVNSLFEETNFTISPKCNFGVSSEKD